MAAGLPRVRPGPNRVTAATFNRVLSATERVEAGGPFGPGQTRSGRFGGSGVVLVKNDESSDAFVKGEIVLLQDAAVDPADGELVINAERHGATSASGYAITLEPIEAGKVGRATLSDIVLAEIDDDAKTPAAGMRLAPAAGEPVLADDGPAVIEWTDGTYAAFRLDGWESRRGEITASNGGTNNQWSYTITLDYGGEITATNAAEAPNGSSGRQGNGVDLTADAPDGVTLTMQPIASGRVVWCRRLATGWEFEADNAVIPDCDA